MLVTLYFLATFLTSVQPEWLWSMHPESGFKVLAPVSLEEYVSDIPTETDVIQLHQFRGGSVSDSILSIAFVVDYHEMPLMEEPKDDSYLRDFLKIRLTPFSMQFQVLWCTWI